MVLARMAATAAATAVAADARLRVTAVAGVLLPAVAIRRLAATAADRRTVEVDPRTAVAGRRTGAAVAADMEGNTALDFFQRSNAA